MSTRAQPKVYNLTVKTHKLMVFITAPQNATIKSLKPEVLSALQAEVLDAPDPRLNATDDDDWRPPKVASIEDFEFARAVKEKGRPTGAYEPLQGTEAIKSALVNWESLFLQFRDSNGKLLPVNVTIPSLLDEDEEEAPQTANKGKRKAPAYSIPESSGPSILRR